MSGLMSVYGMVQESCIAGRRGVLPGEEQGQGVL